MSANIRAHREKLGWSQTDLAGRAGVSRQLVGAMESGRHIPNVRAAMAVAGALGVTVEALFSGRGSTSGPVPVLGDVLPPDGSTAMVAHVGDQLVVATNDHAVTSSERWALADATINGGQVSLLDHAPLESLVLAGCDPALAILSGLVERISRHRVLTVHASTGRSIVALNAGRVHGVLVHAPSGRFPTPPIEVRRWQLARWQVGVASARASGVPTLDEIAGGGLRIVQRDPGAGTQQAFNRAMQKIGATTPVPGPLAEGHIDVARRVAAGAAAGVTMEASARSFHLGFTALEEHTVELWLDARWAALPAAVALVEVLAGSSLQTRLRLIGGYDLTDCGTERHTA